MGRSAEAPSALIAEGACIRVMYSLVNLKAALHSRTVHHTSARARSPGHPLSQDWIQWSWWAPTRRHRKIPALPEAGFNSCLLQTPTAASTGQEGPDMGCCQPRGAANWSFPSATSWPSPPHRDTYVNICHGTKSGKIMSPSREMVCHEICVCATLVSQGWERSA